MYLVALSVLKTFTTSEASIMSILKGTEKDKAVLG